MDIRLDDLQRRLSQLQRRLVAPASPTRAATLSAAAVGALVVGAVAIGAIVIARQVASRRRRLTLEAQPIRELPRPAGDQATSDPPA
jgi:hypothetical protein